MGLVFPSSPDLRITAGSPSLTLGLSTAWRFSERQTLRPRMDYTVFAGKSQGASLSTYQQHIDTKVSSLVLGVDWMLRLTPRWSLGLGLGGTRWSVDSTNVFGSSFGNAVATGTSHVWKLGVAPVLDYHMSPTLTVEGRWHHSRYGRENTSADTGSISLVWRF